MYDQYRDSGKSKKDKRAGSGTAKKGDGKNTHPANKNDSVVYEKISMLKNEIEEIKNIEGALTRENEENKAQLSNVKKIMDEYCEKIKGLNEKNKELREYKDKYSVLENQRGTMEKPEAELKKKIASLEEEIKKKNEIITPPQPQAVNDPAEERLMIVWLRSSLESEQKISAVLNEKIKKLETEIKSLRGKKT